MQNSQSMRAAITGKFKDKMNGTDVHTVNRLIIMGRMELEETLMLWKGASHVSDTADEATPSPCARSFPSCNAQKIGPVPTRCPLQVANWFDNAVEAEKAKAAPPPSFLADFLAGK